MAPSCLPPSPPPPPPQLWVLIYCPRMLTAQCWELTLNSFMYALRTKRGMRGSLIYRPGVTEDDPMTTRIFSLTHPSDYDILLENSAVEPFLDLNGTIIRGESLKITAWNPSITRYEPRCSREKLLMLSQWRHRVHKAMTEPPSRAEQFLWITSGDGPPEQARDLKACQDILTGLHQDVRLPPRFPGIFIPVGIATCSRSKGWVSNIRSCKPRHVEGFEGRIVWDCESIPGRFSGWSQCEAPRTEELIPAPSYECSNTTLSTYVVGWANGLCKRFVEVYPGDILDRDPIGVFQLLPPYITESNLL